MSEKDAKRRLSSGSTAIRERPAKKDRPAKSKFAVPLSEKSAPGKTLDLSLSKVGELQTLPSAFKDAQDSLRKLDLSGQNALAKQLPELRFIGATLTWLSLASMDCSSPDIKWVFLRMLKTLFVLNISKCNLSQLPADLIHASSLKALVASHNSITSPSLYNLAGLVTLNSLILSDNKLTSFPSTLTQLKELKKLSLSNNELRSDTLPDFSSLTSLEELRVNGNAGITSIPAGVVELPALTMLELSHTGIARVADVGKLASAPKLVNLGLRGCPVADTPKYRDVVTAALPNLRILDNVRFDQKYLQRKAKAKEATSAREDAPDTPALTALPQAVTKDPSKKRKRHEVEATSSAKVDPAAVDSSAAVVDKASKAGKVKRKKASTSAEHVIDATKTPKAIGGSLAEQQAEAAAPSVAEDRPQTVEEVARARSSVLKIVDVRKEEVKDRKQRKREKREKARQADAGTDALLDLVKARTEAVALPGWD